MFAFAPATPLVSTRSVSARQSSFTPAVSAPRNASSANGPTMALSTKLRKATPGLAGVAFGGVAKLLERADQYMAKSVLTQYYQMVQPSGMYGVQCTEGTTKGAAEAARVRVLNIQFRESQKSTLKTYGDMYENRKQAIASSHGCSVEEKQFCNYSKVSSTYCVAKAEALGTCDRYATPESVEEAAMARYIDLAQKAAANPSGVYSPSCNEGAIRGQSEELRVAALAAAYRNGHKPVGVLLQEKYNQRKFGYAACKGCSYEEDIVTKFPAVGAGFRSKTYGY